MKEALLVEAQRLRRAAARQENAISVTEAALADDGLAEDERNDLESALTGYTATRDRMMTEVESLEGRARSPRNGSAVARSTVGFRLHKWRRGESDVAFKRTRRRRRDPSAFFRR